MSYFHAVFLVWSFGIPVNAGLPLTRPARFRFFGLPLAGNLVLYDDGNWALWNTGTSQPFPLLPAPKPAPPSQTPAQGPGSAGEVTICAGIVADNSCTSNAAPAIQACPDRNSVALPAGVYGLTSQVPIGTAAHGLGNEAQSRQP